MICVSKSLRDPDLLVISAVLAPQQWTYHAHADPSRPGHFFGLCINAELTELIADYLMSNNHQGDQRVHLILAGTYIASKSDARALVRRLETADSREYLFLGSLTKAWARGLCLQDITNRTHDLCLQRLVQGAQCVVAPPVVAPAD